MILEERQESPISSVGLIFTVEKIWRKSSISPNYLNPSPFLSFPPFVLRIPNHRYYIRTISFKDKKRFIINIIPNPRDPGASGIYWRPLLAPLIRSFFFEGFRSVLLLSDNAINGRFWIKSKEFENGWSISKSLSQCINTV